MAKVWDDFLPLMRPFVPSCPDVTSKLYLAQVASDFFARTYIWRTEIDAVYTAPNLVEYDLDSEAVVEDVIGVVYEETVLDRTDLRLLPLEKLSETGSPTAFYVHNDTTIRIYPIPDARARLTVTAILKPSRTALSVEDWIYETWADVLVSGAVYRVARIPGKDWTNPNLAEEHRLIYERAISNARIRDFRGVPLSVRLRPAA